MLFRSYSKEKSKTKKFLDAKGWMVLGLLATQIGGWVVDAFTETIAVGADTQINTKIDSRIETAMDDANLWRKVITNDNLITIIDSEVAKAKQHIVDEVLEADEKKIDFIGGLGVGAKLRDEEIMPMFVQLLISIDNGELIFKDDIKDLIAEEVEKEVEKEVKKRLTRTVRGSF